MLCYAILYYTIPRVDALVIAVSTDLLCCCLCPLVAVRGYKVGNRVFPQIWSNENVHRPLCKSGPLPNKAGLQGKQHWRVKITSPSPPLWVGINASPFANIGNPPTR